MKAFIGITDSDWFNMLRAQPAIDEVNFWQPGGNRRFQALQAGELFLFKLHAPRNCIVGGGVFAHSTLLPISLAWDTFTTANGVHSLGQMKSRVERYRRQPNERYDDYTIGCILLEQPFFFIEDQWIPVPDDFSSNIVVGKTYDLQQEPGRSLLNAVRERLSLSPAWREPAAASPDGPRYGDPTMIHPRLGQGSFRIVVTDTYERRCAVTREKTLPVLEAAHIKPYGEGGTHEISNGILLRSDLHRLFDRGYVTVTPEHKMVVSRRIREEFENGRDYYALNGKDLWVPGNQSHRPDVESLRWHNEAVVGEMPPCCRIDRPVRWRHHGRNHRTHRADSTFS